MGSRTFVALLLAAGRSTRFAKSLPKTWYELGGAPVVVWSARRLARLAGHRGTILATDEESIAARVPAVRREFESANVVATTLGGATRQESCRLAFEAAATIDAELVLVHDAARPFFCLDATITALEEAAEHGGAILGHRARDTLKRVESGRVVRTIERDAVFHAATPQVFRRDAFEAMLAHARTHAIEGTDEAGLAEACGIPVVAIESPSTNIKITYPEDELVLPALASLLDE
ncbi:MAG: 2-C-methyl-D-erythritol 4-phosphate cytidylyltransferase [Planctomycetes bacterium]|nr:2-C-methyl-D-erythritol 4-phosphate cytidylyltransferase [Planctomycetota bacterium]